MKYVTLIVAAALLLALTAMSVKWLIWFASCHRRRRHAAEITGFLGAVILLGCAETLDHDLLVYAVMVAAAIVIAAIAWLTDFFPTGRHRLI